MKRLLLALSLGLSAQAYAAPTASDIDRAANTAALSVDGIISNCPAPLKTYGTSDRRCVKADLSPDTVRRMLSLSNLNLYGAWRSQEDSRYLYNWVQTSGGSVLVLVGPVAGGSIIYLDRVAQTSAASAFRRTLRLTSPRMNGQDVMALQNRLMDVSKTARGKGGDGWFGPVTEANVMAFQSTNGLKVTGVVDKVTWTRLFSSNARYFSADLAKAIAARTAR